MTNHVTRLPAHQHPDSQMCVGKMFFTCVVPQPEKNRMFLLWVPPLSFYPNLWHSVFKLCLPVDFYVRVNDCVLKVNNIDLTNVEYRTAVQAISRGEVVNMVSVQLMKSFNF